MQKSFKDIAPGIFRARNGLCYTKLKSEVMFGEEKANAVIITNGQFKFFEEDDQVEDSREN